MVDPGFEPEAVIEAIPHRGKLHPVAIVLTHAHLDHAWGVAALKKAFPAALFMVHAEDLPLYENLPGQAEAFGFQAPEAVPAERLLHDGETLAIGEERVLVRHCPGPLPRRRRPPSASIPRSLWRWWGTSLFAGSVGRTDLWGGSFAQLERSIRDVLYRLPDATRVIPGHGPETSIGAEKAEQPVRSRPRNPPRARTPARPARVKG